MGRVRIEDALQMASEHRRAGRVQEAEGIYRQVLQAAPQHPGALNGLAILMAQAGRFDAAAEHFAKVAALMPGNLDVLRNLLECYMRWGKVDETIRTLREMLRLKSDWAGGHFQLGVALVQKGVLEEAAASYRRAIELEPNHAEWHVNLGGVLEASGKLAAARSAYERSLAVGPELAGAHNNLGNLLAKFGDAAGAIRHLQWALELDPKSPEAQNNLGNVLLQQGRYAEAEALFRQALASIPNDPEVHNNLGNALKERGSFDEAATHFRRAAELAPMLAGAPSNLGNVLRELGRMEEAIACYERAMSIAPGDAVFESNRVLAMQYLDACDGAAILQAGRRWEEHHGRGPRRGEYANDRSAERRLKIGYVSADLRMHSVAFFLLPLLEAHDRQNVHVTCYAASAKRDAITERMQQHVDEWRSLAGVGDDAACEMIERDQIDILVDLTGHTAGGRLGVFARQPAPVQCTYLGYPGTTGLSAIDYRLSDRWADPEGEADAMSSEKIVRLEGGAWCFSPIVGSPEVSALPASGGGVTFGTFNSFAKITPRMLGLWAELLGRVGGSRLVLKNTAMGTASAAARVREVFAARGIAADRVELLGPQAGIMEHLHAYHRIDIALDTFPYHGTTTTCEALWMGVPVVTLAGQRHASRVGVSLLTSVGLPQMIASSDRDYVDIAANLASNGEQLAEMRRGLRERMQQSPLMDAKRLAREMEQAYRMMWRSWVSR